MRKERECGLERVVVVCHHSYHCLVPASCDHEELKMTKKMNGSLLKQNFTLNLMVGFIVHDSRSLETFLSLELSGAKPIHHTPEASFPCGQT